MDETPVPVMRVAAYAVIVVGRRVLLTQMAPNTPVPGLWALPGGGVRHGETPLEAVVREVFEETGHTLDQPRLLDVGTDRFTGRSPSGRLEDFQSIQIVYTSDVVEVGEPQVLEVDGSTAQAAWVPWDELPALPMIPSARRWLDRETGSSV